jgi:hypothetical protein
MDVHESSSEECFLATIYHFGIPVYEIKTYDEVLCPAPDGLSQVKEVEHVRKRK